jgi:hypothetical protein
VKNLSVPTAAKTTSGLGYKVGLRGEADVQASREQASLMMEIVAGIRAKTIASPGN